MGGGGGGGGGEGDIIGLICVMKIADYVTI